MVFVRLFCVWGEGEEATNKWKGQLTPQAHLAACLSLSHTGRVRLQEHDDLNVTVVACSIMKLSCNNMRNTEVCEEMR